MAYTVSYAEKLEFIPLKPIELSSILARTDYEFNTPLI